MNTVVQIDMDGNTILSDNNASFSDTKSEAKDILGSVEKIGDNQILIADAMNKRAIIVDTRTSRIIWEYVSDRYIFDAHLFIQNDININVSSNNLMPLADIVLTYGTVVNWINQTGETIGIYEGKVDANTFDINFDIELYPKLSLIENTETFSYRMLRNGELNWFSYPIINIGKIFCSELRFSKDDFFLITEGDSMDSLYTSRVVKIDAWGKTVWDFGNGYLSKPRDARPLLNNKIIIST